MVSQNCAPVALIFTRQSQIDSFPINYPGCTIIDGNLGIPALEDPNDPITNLDSLKYLSEIKGSVQLLSTTLLNTKGLKNVKKIGGSFIIKQASDLIQLNLDSLERIGGQLRIEYNPNLMTIDSFKKLKFAGGILLINSTNNLPNINSFNVLDSVAGDIVFEVSGITNLNAFKKTKYVQDKIYFNIYSNGSNVAIFDSLSSTGNDIKFQTSFNNLDLSGFKKLKYVKRLGFYGSIDFADAFDSLKAIQYDLTMNGNTAISNLPFFPNLDSIGSNFNIISNPILTSVSELNSLDYIYTLFIENNVFLSDISGFIPVGKIENLEIIGNTFLSVCNIMPICSLLYNNSNVFLYNNNTGCNSQIEIQLGCPAPPDTDMDGINDYLDNCPLNSNPNQEDMNNDGIGDACQDSDSDSFLDYVDNCPLVENSNQLDTDGDGFGDLCDNCPMITNIDQEDWDNDGIGDACDICISLNTSNNNDTDGDGIGDACDNCPNAPNPTQYDCNGNGIGDACDILDTDCDGIPDLTDNCPNIYNPLQIDNNNNGIGDNCEVFPKLGFGTDQPKAEYHFSNGNLYIDNPAMNIIYRLPNGQCYFIRPHGNGLYPIVQYTPCPQ